jgi:hypothetical protein
MMNTNRPSTEGSLSRSHKFSDYIYVPRPFQINVNQRYATSAITHSVLKVIADAAGVPLQKMVVRNDSGCGSTVGPILATKLAIQTIDVRHFIQNIKVILLFCSGGLPATGDALDP